MNTIPPTKKIYFASDFHLGAPDYLSSRERENRIVRWLDSIKADAAEIYLLGDTFDFWFEYAHVIPKGFIRLQGKLAELSDAGIQITLFRGNHDMWMFHYFQQELRLTIISNELILDRNGKKFYLHHGDGLGSGEFGYKCLRSFFRNKFSQWIFACIHPNLGMKIAKTWSKQSRIANLQKEEFHGEASEWLVTYAKDFLGKQPIDYFIFGHRHLPLDIQLSPNSRYINLGEWINYNSYAIFDGSTLQLNYFEESPATMPHT